MILSALLAICSAFSSCGGNGGTSYAPDTDDLTLSKSEMTVDYTEQTFTIDVKAGSEFSAYTTDETWLQVTPKSSTKREETLTVTVKANESRSERSGSVVVNAGGTRRAVTVTQGEAPKPDIEGPEGYTLVWNDEFEGETLGGDWTYEIQGPGWVNNELQNYVSNGGVTVVSNGTLKINLKKDGKNINSARIYAKRSQGWKYGYVEARIKLPKGKGTWPAFWMMPVNFTAWPADGEIDIMEEVGYNPNVVHSTIHCNKYNNTGTAIESAHTTVPTAQTEFHVYAMDWTADRMVFYVDGEPLLTYRNDGSGKDAWPFDSPFYIILNLAWGGGWGGLQGVDESCLPATMEVDYVRVFQKE